MSNPLNDVGSGPEYPCIEFSTPSRTFERLFKDTTLKSLRGAVSKKLGVGPSSKLEFIQQRDNGKAYDLEDDDDFDAFRAYAFKKGFVNVKIKVTEAPQKAAPEAVVPVATAASAPVTSQESSRSSRPPVINVDSANPYHATSTVSNDANRHPILKKPSKVKKLAATESTEPAIPQKSVSGKPAHAPADSHTNRTGEPESDAATMHAKPKKAKKKVSETIVDFVVIPAPAEAAPQHLSVAAAEPTPSINKAAPLSGKKAMEAIPQEIRLTLEPQQVASVQHEPVVKKTRHAPPNTVRFSEPDLPSVAQGPAAAASAGNQAPTAVLPDSTSEEPAKRKRGRPKKILEAPAEPEPLKNAEVEPVTPPASDESPEQTEPKERGPKPKKKVEALAESEDTTKDADSVPSQGTTPAPITDKAVPKKRGPKKKDAAFSVETTSRSEHSETPDTSATARSVAPQDKPAPKKRGPKPKQTTGDVEMEDIPAQVNANNELPVKGAKVKKRKKSEVPEAREIDDKASKKRKLTPEATSPTQEADPNDPLPDQSSTEGMNPLTTTIHKIYQSTEKEKRELTERERQQQDSALDEIVNRVKGRIAASAKDGASEATKYPAPQVNLNLEQYLYDSDEDIGADYIRRNKAVTNSAEAPPTPPRKTFNLHLQEDVMHGKKQESAPIMHEDIEMEYAFSQPPPSEQQPTTASNGASTTQVEEGDAEAEEEEGAGDEEDELKSDAVQVDTASPAIATVPLDFEASSESGDGESGESGESETEEGPAVKMDLRRNLATSTPRPSMGSLPSLRNIAETSSKAIFSSPRDTPSGYPLFSASQPVSGTKQDVVAETDPSSSSESGSDSDEGNVSHIPKGKRAGATIGPRVSKGLKGAFMQYFGSQP